MKNSFEDRVFDMMLIGFLLLLLIILLDFLGF